MERDLQVSECGGQVPRDKGFSVCGLVFRQARRSLIFWMAVIVGMVTGFYSVENWRGKRAWERIRAEAAGRGVELEAGKFRAAPVPSRSNVLAAPMMTEWFTAPNQRRIVDRMQLSRAFTSEKDAVAVLRCATTLEPGEAGEIQLQQAARYVFLKVKGEERKTTDIPLIIMDEVPLPDAIRNLARQAELNYVIAPGALQAAGQGKDAPLVTLRWENVTAQQALEALLSNYNLDIVEQPKTRIWIVNVRSRTPSGCRFHVSAREALRRAFEARNVAGQPPPSLARLQAVSSGFVLFSDTDHEAAQPVPPVRVALESEIRLTPGDLENMLQTSELFERRWGVSVRDTGENSFGVFCGVPPFCGASVYLERTERFGREFELLHEALKRPAVRHELAGDMTRPFVNQAAIITMAIILSDRAQAHLLLDQPAEALAELRLLQGLSRMLEIRPGEPFGLAAASREVWLMGMCGTVISDGFRLGKWREAQFRELQELLAGVDLPAAVARAFAFERAAAIKDLEQFGADDYVRSFLPTGPKMEWDRIKSPPFWYLTLAPKGWVYQNMVKVAQWTEGWGEVYDGVAGRVDSGVVTRNRALLESDTQRRSLFKVLARMAVPSTERCWEATAEKQALLSQAMAACALERYKLAHGSYPESLAELRPAFLAEVPRDCMSGEEMVYHRMPGGEFLLYSVGWNQRDEGGWVGDAKRGGGDWVWPQFLGGAAMAAGG